MNHLGIEALTDPLLLAKRKVARSIMASSYDRRGGNHDWSNYVRREGKAAVMMESDGPGCITRIWTADPQKGTIRLYIDGNPKPAVETPFAKLFDLLPLSLGIGGESTENYATSKAERVPMGHTSYCPIPFQHHCKVTIEPEDDYLYYHINAHLLPPGTEVHSFDPRTSLNIDPIRLATRAISDWTARKPLVPMSAAARSEFELPPGESRVLLDHSGAGVVRGLRLSLHTGLGAREAEHIRNNVWLLAHFDEDEPRDASIRCPIGPFFLDYGQDPKPKSLFLGADESGEYYCFLPMPHHQKAHVVIENRSVLPVRIASAVLHEGRSQIDSDLLRFRATWHVTMPMGPDHRDYEGLACRLLNLDGANNVELLYAHGAGHFVGCGFNADMSEAPTDRACGEGEEMFFVDDDPRLTMYGTGTEDYVNDAWGIRGYAGPLSGDAISGEWGVNPQLFGYRLHVPDPIPFVRKGRFTLEHGTGNNCSGTYRSVAYWYMDPSLTRTRTEEWRWEAIRTGKRVANAPEAPGTS